MLFCELKAYFLQGYIVLTSPRNAPSSVLGIALDVLGGLTTRGSARSSSQGRGRFPEALPLPLGVIVDGVRAFNPL